MPEVTVARTPWGKGLANTMAVTVEGGATVSLVSSPPTVEFTAAAWTVTETERPGRKMISTAAAPGLRTLHLEHRVAAPNPNQSVESFIAALRDVAEKGARVQFVGGDAWSLGSWWWVRSLEVREDLKTSEHKTSRATLVWECVESSLVSRVVLGKGKVKDPVSSPDDEAKYTPPKTPEKPETPRDNWENIPSYPTDNWQNLPGYPTQNTGGGGDNRTEF